ncbi:Putative ribonuclease H protein At1g65750 [Linum perenne]
MNLGKCSITRAELRGVVSVLQLAWERGYRKIQQSATIIKAIELLQRNWEVQIIHVYRESNHAADYLANVGHSCPLGFHVLEQFDPNFCYWLHYDQLGVSEECLILNEV